MAKKPDAHATATAATVRTTRWSSTARGLGGRRPDRVRRAMPAKRVASPVAVTSPSPSPSTTKVPAKAGASRLDDLGHALAGQRGCVDPQPVCLQQLEIGRDAVTRTEHHEVADHELVGVDIGTAAVAHHGHTAGQQLPQLFSRPVRLVFLCEREHSVHDDHDHDGHRQLGQPGQPGEGSRHPQHHREEVHELRPQPLPQRNARRGGKAVRAVAASRARASDQLRPARLTSGPARSVTRRWSRPERESGKGEGPFFERAPARDLRLCATPGEVGHSRAGARPARTVCSTRTPATWAGPRARARYATWCSRTSTTGSDRADGMPRAAHLGTRAQVALPLGARPPPGRGRQARIDVEHPGTQTEQPVGERAVRATTSTTDNLYHKILEMPGIRVSVYPTVKQTGTATVATSANLIPGPSGTEENSSINVVKTSGCRK